MDTTTFPICARCEERIGTYEPLCWRRSDGTVALSSLLRAREDPGHGLPDVGLYHRDCFDDAQPTSPWSSA